MTENQPNESEALEPEMVEHELIQPEIEKKVNQIRAEIRELHIKIGASERYMDQSKKDIETLKDKILNANPEITEMIKKHNQKGADWQTLVTEASQKVDELIYLGVERDV